MHKKLSIIDLSRFNESATHVRERTLMGLEPRLNQLDFRTSHTYNDIETRMHLAHTLQHHTPRTGALVDENSKGVQLATSLVKLEDPFLLGQDISQTALLRH
jgi:hypothetical protein